VLCDVDVAALVNAVSPGGAAMALRSHPDAVRYGIVAADATGTIVQLANVATAVPEGDVDRSTHFTGLHAMDRDALERVPDGFSDIVRTAYRELVPERRVRGLVHPGFWLDVGDPSAYLDANLAVLDGGLALPLDPFTRGERRDGSWIGPGAEIAGARITRSVVGAGARVPAGTVLVDSVVWDGAEVPPGEHHRVVVHDAGILTEG
jgi:mannose-1-phosphate guanylyltransferase